MEQTQKANQPHPKKHFSEEAALDKVEKKLDEKMGKIMKQWFVHKFLNHKIVKQILWSHFVSDINHKINPYLKTIFIVVGWISVVTWLIGIFSFLVGLSGLGFMFSLGAGIGIRVLIYVLLSLAFSLLSLFTWIGMIRFKKWVISLVVLGFIVSALLFILSLIPVGLYSYRSYGSFGGGLFNLIITFVMLVLVLKNESLFKN